MNDISKKLNEDFKDKEYAHAYMEDFCVDRIASQIYCLRKQRDLSQEQLSEISGIAQERISKLESGDFSSLTMKTLNKLSKAFDVNLSIKFDSFSKAIVDVASFNESALRVSSRLEDINKPFLEIIESRAMVSERDASTIDFFADFQTRVAEQSISTATVNYGCKKVA